MMSHLSSAAWVWRKSPRLTLPISSSPSMRKMRLTGSSPSASAAWDAVDVGEDLALVVRGTARVDDAVLDARLEGRRFPEVERIGGLHVVMAVDHDRGTARLVFVARDDDRVAGRGVFLGGEADALELHDEPVRALVGVGLVRGVGGDAGEAEELDQVGDGVVLGGVALRVGGHQAHARKTGRKPVVSVGGRNGLRGGEPRKSLAKAAKFEGGMRSTLLAANPAKYHDHASGQSRPFSFWPRCKDLR